MEKDIDKKTRKKIKFEVVDRGGIFFCKEEDFKKGHLKLQYEYQVKYGNRFYPVNAVCLCCGEILFVDYEEIVEIEAE